MSKWDTEGLARAMDQFSPADPSDAKERKRRALIRSATELFVQQGYRKTSVDEIAQRAGVAKGTVYLYFKTKGELLLHAIVAEKRRYLSKLEPIMAEQDPRERLRMWLRMALVLANDMPLLSRLLGGDHEIFAALGDMPAETMSMRHGLMHEYLGELIDAAAAPHRYTEHELRDRATVLGGFVFFSALITDDNIRGELSIDRFATILTDMIVDGVGTAGGTP